MVDLRWNLSSRSAAPGRVRGPDSGAGREVVRPKRPERRAAEPGRRRLEALALRARRYRSAREPQSRGDSDWLGHGSGRAGVLPRLVPAAHARARARTRAPRADRSSQLSRLPPRPRAPRGSVPPHVGAALPPGRGPRPRRGTSPGPSGQPRSSARGSLRQTGDASGAEESQPAWCEKGDPPRALPRYH